MRNSAETNGQKKGAIRKAKRDFFDKQITRLHQSRIWDVVPWTQPRRQTANVTLHDSQGNPVIEPGEIAKMLQEQFTPSSGRTVSSDLIDEMPDIPKREMPVLSDMLLIEALAQTSNFSASGPDHVDWFWLKKILNDDNEVQNDDGNIVHAQIQVLHCIRCFFQACIYYNTWPDWFKESQMVVLPKPKRPDYALPKAYRPICLLNCMGKLFEKVLARHMQYTAQKYGIAHAGQYGGLMQHATTDADVALVHTIKTCWNQGLESAALLVDVAQFFPSINHDMLLHILEKQGFHETIVNFFRDYLTDRSMTFLFNGTETPPAAFTLGVQQGSALSPVLANLYIAPVIKLVEQKINEQFPGTTLMFFVDDGLIHVFS